MASTSSQQQLSHSLSLKSQQNQLQLQNLLQQEENTRSFKSQHESIVANMSKTNPNPKPSVFKDPRDPLNVQVPVESNPTDVLAGRFSAWRSIIRSLITYLKEVVAVHEEIIRQQIRLQHAVQFGSLSSSSAQSNSRTSISSNTHNTDVQDSALVQKFFLPMGNGSIQDLPAVLTQFHTANASTSAKTAKELSNVVLPRLEDLRKDLMVKIKEIRNLQSDFKSSVGREVAETRALLSQYQTAIEISRKNPNQLQGRQDPYLIKTQLDKQIKKQLVEENYLHEAFLNLQTSGKELEKVVVIEIQNCMTTYAKLLGQEAQTVFDVLITKLDQGFLTKEPTFEWDSFISKDSNFMDPNLPSRHFSDMAFTNHQNPLSFEVRSGFLERRSKYLKSYSRGWYVLTANFIHEFKSSDRKKDPIPVMSLSLDDCQVAEHSKKDSSNLDTWHKFVLHAKQNGIMHRGHNWVFRADSYDSMMNWYNDIKRLTNLPNPVERSKSIMRSSVEATVTPPSQSLQQQLTVTPPQEVLSHPNTTMNNTRTSTLMSNASNRSKLSNSKQLQRLEELREHYPPSKQQSQSHITQTHPYSQQTTPLVYPSNSSPLPSSSRLAPPENMVSSDGIILTPVVSDSNYAKNDKSLPYPTNEALDYSSANEMDQSSLSQKETQYNNDSSTPILNGNASEGNTTFKDDADVSMLTLESDKRHSMMNKGSKMEYDLNGRSKSMRS